MKSNEILIHVTVWPGWEGVMGTDCLMGVSIKSDEKVLERDSRNGCTTL